MPVTTIMYLLLVIFAGCLTGEDEVNFKGINDSSSSSNSSSGPVTNQTDQSRSLVKSLSVKDNYLVIKGENLDQVLDLTLYSDDSPNAISSGAEIPLKDLKIVFQSRTQIIAQGLHDTVNLFLIAL